MNKVLGSIKKRPTFAGGEPLPRDPLPDPPPVPKGGGAETDPPTPYTRNRQLRSSTSGSRERYPRSHRNSLCGMAPPSTDQPASAVRECIVLTASPETILPVRGKCGGTFTGGRRCLLSTARKLIGNCRSTGRRCRISTLYRRGRCCLPRGRRRMRTPDPQVPVPRLLVQAVMPI